MLYEVRKTVSERRGVSVERYELFVGDAYVLGLDIPPRTDMEWYRIAAKRVRANLFNRHNDDKPEFGATPNDPHALTFAGMLNDA